MGKAKKPAAVRKGKLRLQIEHAMLSRHVGAMARVVGVPPVYMKKGESLGQAVGRLRTEHVWLRRRLSRAGVVGGDGGRQWLGTAEAAVGAADPRLWQGAYDVVMRANPGAWSAETLAAVTSGYEEAYARKHRIPVEEASVAAWTVVESGAPGTVVLDLSRPLGDGFARCGSPRSDTGLDRQAAWPRCLAEDRVKKLAAEDPRLLRYAALVRQVKAMEMCLQPGQSAPPTRLRPPKGTDIDSAIQELEARHAGLKQQIAEGRRCKVRKRK